MGHGKQEQAAPFACFIIDKKKISLDWPTVIFFPGVSAGEWTQAGSKKSSREQLPHTSLHRAPRVPTASPPPPSSQGLPPTKSLSSQGSPCPRAGRNVWGTEEERWIPWICGPFPTPRSELPLLGAPRRP